MPSVVMLYQDEKLPSSRVRVLNLVSGLRDLGIDAVTQRYPDTLEGKLRLLPRLGDYDLVLLQKKLVTWVDLLLLRRMSKKIAFDYDDAIYMKDDQAAETFSRTRRNRFRNIALNSDLMIAGNPILAAYGRRYNTAVEIVPSAVPHAGVAVKNWQLRNGKLVVGWIGGRGNLQHLEIAGPALARLSQEIDLELRVISNRDFRLEGVSVKNVSWSLETQEREMAQFDVGIMPLPKTPWSEGKCSYKLLQYMAAGVPVVATDWGFNSTVVQAGKNGFLAQEPDDFYHHIKVLHENRALAQEMGDAARLLIEREFSLAAVTRKLGAKLQGALAPSSEGSPVKRLLL